VASVAVHGLLLAWLGSSASVPGTDGAASQLVQIELVAANHSAATSKTTAVIEPQTVAPTTTNLQAKVTHSTSATPVASNQTAIDTTDVASAGVADASSEASDRAGERQQLVVREHLERFKYYPASARRRGIAGDVEVAFYLRPDGMAEQVLVLASSGYDILDQAALETVSRAQPFPAAGGQYQFRLRFRKL